MPTVITKSVGSGGGRDYSTLNDFFAAIPSNLVTADQQWIGELYNDSTFPAATLSGKTTDATRNIIIRCAAGHSFKDHANKLTNALYPNQSYGVLLSAGGDVFGVSVDNTTIEGIQFSSAASVAAYQSGSGSNVVFKNCIMATGGSGSAGSGINLYDGLAVNCLAISTGDVSCCQSNSNARFRNVTCVKAGGGGTRYGFRGNYDSPLYINCASFGFGTPFMSGANGSSNYNASDGTAGPGANSVGSLTFANQFVNTSTDFRLKAGNSLAAGTRDQTYTSDLDIVGSSRSTTTPCIGAWEYSASSSVYVPVNIAKSRQIGAFF